MDKFSPTIDIGFQDTTSTESFVGGIWKEVVYYELLKPNQTITAEHY